MTSYKITKDQCQKSIKGICSQCGGILEPIETVDNSRSPTFWSGCQKCSRFNSGVNPKVYAIAKELVEEGFRPYRSIHHKSEDSNDVRQYKIEQQIAGACNIVMDVLRIQEKHQK